MRVFLSYSRRDLDAASLLRRQLLEAGFEAYLDMHDISKGEPWRDRLAGLIERADVVVFMISPDSTTSEVCDWEINEAERLGKRIVPTVIRETPNADIPQRLARLNYVFLNNPQTFQTEFAGLAESLNADALWIREHTRLSELANRWSLAKRPARLLLRGKDIQTAEDWRSARTPTAPEISVLHAEYIDASRRTAVNQQRAWFAGLSITLALTVSLAIFALLQRNDAIVARNVAEGRALRLQVEATARNAISALDTTDNYLAGVRAVQALDMYRSSGASELPGLVERSLLTAARTSREIARIDVHGQPTYLMPGGEGSQVDVILRSDRLLRVDPDRPDPVKVLFVHPAFDPRDDDAQGNLRPREGQWAVHVDSFGAAEQEDIDAQGVKTPVQPRDLLSFARFAFGENGVFIGEDTAGHWRHRDASGEWRPLTAAHVGAGDLTIGPTGQSLVVAGKTGVEIYRREGEKLVTVTPDKIDLNEFAADFVLVSRNDRSVVLNGAAVGSDRGTYFVDVRTGAVQSLVGYGARHQRASEMAVSPDGMAVAILFEDEGVSSLARQKVEVWTRSGFRALPPMSVPSGEGLSFSADGASIWVGDYVAGEVRQYRLDFADAYVGLDGQAGLWRSSVCPDSSEIVYLYGQDLWKVDLAQPAPVPVRLTSGFDSDANLQCLGNGVTAIAFRGTNQLVSNDASGVSKILAADEDLMPIGAVGGQEQFLGRESGRLYSLADQQVGPPGERLFNEPIEHVVLDRNKKQAMLIGQTGAAVLSTAEQPIVQRFALAGDSTTLLRPRVVVSNADMTMWIASGTGVNWTLFDKDGKKTGERADPHYPLTHAIANLPKHSLFISGGAPNRVSVLSEGLEPVTDDWFAFDDVSGAIDIHPVDADRIAITDLNGVILLASLSEASVVKSICSNLGLLARGPNALPGLTEGKASCDRLMKPKVTRVGHSNPRSVAE